MVANIGRLVSILYRKNQVYLNVALKDMNIGASAVPFIRYLWHHDGASQEELSSFLLIDKSATARAVQLLIDKGFLRKERDMADRRVNKLYLTDHARELMPRIQERLLWWSDYVTSGLDEELVGVTYSALEKMVEKVEMDDVRERWERDALGGE